MMKTLLKHLEFLKQLRNPRIKEVKNEAYQNLFRSPQGEEVLVDLMRHCKFGADLANSKDTQKMMYDLGKQAALTFIMSKL